MIHRVPPTRASVRQNVSSHNGSSVGLTTVLRAGMTSRRRKRLVCALTAHQLLGLWPLLLRRLHVVRTLMQDEVSHFAVIVLDEFDVRRKHSWKELRLGFGVEGDFALTGGLGYQLAILHRDHNVEPRLKFKGPCVLCQYLGIDLNG